MADHSTRVRELLSSFSQTSASTAKPSQLVTIGWDENPLNPYLMSYCFEQILGFEIDYRPFEKIHYVIWFDYRGTHGCVSHRKLSYDLAIDMEYRDEIIDLLAKARLMLEELFLEMAKDSMNRNEFTMVNEYFHFNHKFGFYADRIKRLHDLIESQREDSRAMSGTGLAMNLGLLNEKFALTAELQKEMLYAIESHIDVFYSFAEHILTLLCPFTEQFDALKPYGDTIHNPKWTWEKKIRSIASTPEIVNLIEPLRKIREIHRNRSAHGMFSRELKLYVGINGFGRYPLYIGKEYLRGFIDDDDVSLDHDKHCEYREVFDRFFSLLDEHYQIPMAIIKSGLPIPVNIRNIVSGIATIGEAKAFAKRLLDETDNQLNMDW